MKHGKTHRNPWFFDVFLVSLFFFSGCVWTSIWALVDKVCIILSHSSNFGEFIPTISVEVGGDLSRWLHQRNVKICRLQLVCNVVTLW